MSEEDVNWWLDQSIKREAAQDAIERAYQETGQVTLPPEAEWREFPCDVCFKRVGDTGHMAVSVVDVQGKHAFMQVRCRACHEALEVQPSRRI